MIQSVSRYALLPLAVIGLLAGMRWNWRTTSLLLVTIFYYLVPGTFAHTELRYVLPVHYLLPILAGAAIIWTAATWRHLVRSPAFTR
jgi:hypothetical protein